MRISVSTTKASYRSSWMLRGFEDELTAHGILYNDIDLLRYSDVLFVPRKLDLACYISRSRSLYYTTPGAPSTLYAQSIAAKRREYQNIRKAAGGRSATHRDGVVRGRSKAEFDGTVLAVAGFDPYLFVLERMVDRSGKAHYLRLHRIAVNVHEAFCLHDEYPVFELDVAFAHLGSDSIVDMSIFEPRRNQFSVLLSCNDSAELIRFDLVASGSVTGKSLLPNIRERQAGLAGALFITPVSRPKPIEAQVYLSVLDSSDLYLVQIGKDISIRPVPGSANPRGCIVPSSATVISLGVSDVAANVEPSSTKIELTVIATTQEERLYTIDGKEQLLPLIGGGSSPIASGGSYNLLDNAIGPIDFVCGIARCGLLFGTRGQANWGVLLLPKMVELMGLRKDQRGSTQRAGRHVSHDGFES